MLKQLQAVILAGGRGTRLGPLGKKLPKAMLDINGTPFMDILIKQLEKNGIKNFLILTGYKKKIIKEYYKKKNKIKIHCGDVNWSSLTRIVLAKKYIKNNFILMYCDNYLENYNLKKQIKIQKQKKSSLIFSVVKKKQKQKGSIIEKNHNIYYEKGISSKFTEAGYILTKKNFFFKDVKKFRKNTDLSEYFNYLTLNYSAYGVYHNNKYQCIENIKLLKKTINYFKNKKI